MSMDYTKAAIHLSAVLRNLEELCVIDEAAQALIAGKQRSIQFIVRSGPTAWLNFSGGACTMSTTGGPNPIKLWFKSAEHFNAMMEGRANPIPIGGLTRLGFLTRDFTALTKRLEYYLKPEAESLKDPAYYQHHTRLLLNTAAYAVACIGNHDPVGRLIAERIPDGVISILNRESGQQVFLHAANGRLQAAKTPPDIAHSYMIFDNTQAVYDALSENVGLHELIISEKLQLKGLLPMVQHMGDLLAKVPLYL
jgi:hypothetical protein